MKLTPELKAKFNRGWRPIVDNSGKLLVLIHPERRLLEFKTELGFIIRDLDEYIEMTAVNDESAAIQKVGRRVATGELDPRKAPVKQPVPPR